MWHVGIRQPSLICFWTSVHLLFSYKIARFWASCLSKAYFSKLIAQYFSILAHKIQIFHQLDKLYGLYNFDKKLSKENFLRDLIFSFFCKIVNWAKRHWIWKLYKLKGTFAGVTFQWEITFGRGRWGHSKVIFLQTRVNLFCQNEKNKKKWNSIY